MNKTLSMLVIATTLTGCSTTPSAIDPNYAAFVDAQKAIALNKTEQPLFRLKAQPGQQIELKGVEEFVVFAPGKDTQQSVVSQYQAPRNQWVEFARATLPVIGMVGGIWAAGNAATNLAQAVGDSSNAGYQYVQAPQANNSIGGDGVIGAGSFSTNTVVTTTTSDLSGSGVLGTGDYTPNSLAGTGSIGGDYNYVPDNSVTNPPLIMDTGGTLFGPAL